MSHPANMPTRFAAAMADLGLKQGDALVVAVSGGADSMALSLLVAAWTKVADQVHFVTVDHGIRAKASADEALRVQQWLEGRGLQHHILALQEPAPTSDLQAWARDKRYQALEGFCQKLECANLLLAHHQDDQAETVLMRLMRGSGVDGLSAMQKQQPILDRRLPQGGCPVVRHRPLLGLSKQDLISYLQEQQQAWIEDPSNQNDHFQRVQARKFLANQGESVDVAKRLAETADRFQRVKLLLDRLIDGFFHDHAQLHPEGWAEFDLATYKDLDEELALRVLTRLCRAIGGQVYPPRLAKTAHLWRQLLRDDFKAATLSGTKFVAKDHSMIRVMRETGRLDHHLNVEGMISGHPIVWDNRFLCHFKKNVGQGMYLAALGPEGVLTLKERIADDHACWMLPRDVLRALPALWQNGQLQAVGLLDHGDILDSVAFAPTNPLIKGRNR